MQKPAIKGALSSVGSSSSGGGKSWPQYDKMIKCFSEFTEEFKRHIDLYFKTFKKNQREYQHELEA
jgi:hypothetical protein